ncbi:MAG: cytochrome c biogenesis protein ResB [Planctomycetes bacterium]|nr:cytochrome c biogenesis protein ResB [Planctomycetota bacterium]
MPRHGTPGTTHARSRAVRVGRSALAVVSSTGLACVLLVLLGVLTWLGTLAQVELGLYAAQQRYFESFGLVHHAGPVPIPLPGGMLVLVLLAVNLIVGGLLRLRRGLATLGVLVAHVGILMLLAAGLVKTLCAREGHVTLHEGESAAHFESWQRWELAITEPIDGGRARELVVPEERFLQAREGAAARLRSAELPFEIEVERFLANCEPAPADAVAHVGSTVDGVFLREKPRDPTAERNLAGAHVTLVDRASGARRSGLVWAAERAPFVAEVGGRRFAIELRHERYPMPFTLTLDEFRKEDHPGTGMARSFESDVRVVEGAAARPVRISMNQPLRAGGLVVYQASWGPSNARPGEPLFSTFAVVSNPSDAWPLWSCVVIAAGLVFHFGRKLGRHVRAEARRA